MCYDEPVVEDEKAEEVEEKDDAVVSTGNELDATLLIWSATRAVQSVFFIYSLCASSVFMDGDSGAQRLKRCESSEIA